MAKKRPKPDSMMPPPWWHYEQFNRQELLLIQAVFNRAKFCGHESQTIADFLIKVKNLLDARPGPLPGPMPGEPEPFPHPREDEPNIEPA